MGKFFSLSLVLFPLTNYHQNCYFIIANKFLGAVVQNKKVPSSCVLQLRF